MNVQHASIIDQARSLESPLWERVAADLEKSSRRRRIVNLSRISRASQAGETVIVPGKVLGSGDIDHKVTVVAANFSSSALEKLKDAGCDAITIAEFLDKDPKGTGRIIG